MRVRELLTEARTHNQVQASSKKQLLDQVAQLAAAGCDSLNEQEVFDALVAREKLGSTGIGEGIAIPHCRLGHCRAELRLSKDNHHLYHTAVESEAELRLAS